MGNSVQLIMFPTFVLDSFFFQLISRVHINLFGTSMKIEPIGVGSVGVGGCNIVFLISSSAVSAVVPLGSVAAVVVLSL